VGNVQGEPGQGLGRRGWVAVRLGPTVTAWGMPGCGACNHVGPDARSHCPLRPTTISCSRLKGDVVARVGC